MGGEVSIPEKIESAEAFLSLKSTVVIPVTTALIYTFIWPWVSSLIEKYQIMIDFNKMKYKLNSEAKLTQINLRYQLEDLRLEEGRKYNKHKANFKDLNELVNGYQKMNLQVETIDSEHEALVEKLEAQNNDIQLFLNNFSNQDSELKFLYEELTKTLNKAMKAHPYANIQRVKLTKDNHMTNVRKKSKNI